MEEIKEGDIVEIIWLDAQSWDMNPSIFTAKELLESPDIQGIKCSIVSYFIGEKEGGYLVAKEKWETGQYKYIHFIPIKSVITITKSN